MLPQTQGSVALNPKTLTGTMASLTPEASSVNQTKDLQSLLSSCSIQTLLWPSSPTSSSTLQVYSLAGLCGRNHHRPAGSERDLSLGTVT